MSKVLHKSNLLVRPQSLSGLVGKWTATAVLLALLLPVPVLAVKDSHGPKDFGNSGKQNLSVEFIEGLNFGKVSANSNFAGRVVINPQTGLKETYGTYDLGGDYSRAELEIRGVPQARFLLTLPRKVVLSGRGSVATKVTDFKAYPSTAGVLGADGKAIVYLGATLTLQANQKGAESSGRINMFVDYLP